MLCFTTTKKVRGLIRNKLPKRRTRTERQTTMTRFSGGTNTEMVSDSPIMKKGKIKGEVFHNYVQGSQNLESCNLLEESLVVTHNGAREELKNADSLIGIEPSRSK